MPAAAAVPQANAQAGVFGQQGGQRVGAQNVGQPPPPFSGAPNTIQQPGVTAGQGQPQPQAPAALPAPQQGQPQGGSSDGSFQRPDGTTDWEVGSGPKYDWGGMSARTGRAPTSPPPPEADSVDPTRGSAWRQAQAAHDQWIQSQLRAGLSLADLGFAPTRGGGLSIYMRYGGPGGLGEQLQKQGGGGAAPNSPGRVGVPGGEGTQQGVPGTVGIPTGEAGAAQPTLPQNSAGQANQGGLLGTPGGPPPVGIGFGGSAGVGNMGQGFQQALMQLLMQAQQGQGLQGQQGGGANPQAIMQLLGGGMNTR